MGTRSDDKRASVNHVLKLHGKVWAHVSRLTLHDARV
jgi:hypothetical protein